MKIFLKWGVVAGATFTLDLILFAIFIRINSSIIFANSISFLLSSIFNFNAHQKWTFKIGGLNFNYFKRYVQSIFLSYILNTTFIFMNSTFLMLIYSKVMSNLIMIPINFYLMRKYTFKS